MKKKCLIFGIIVFLCGVFFSAAGIVAQAKDDAFVVEAQLLPSDEPVYCVQLTVENAGGDWEGIVRLLIDTSYGLTGSCVYDTALSLPQGSTKQFEVKLPRDSVDRTDGFVTVRLLDEKGNMSAERKYAKLLQDSATAIPMGILSDSYASLTYLDMGGDELNFGDRSRPVKLVQITQENLMTSLDSVFFLAIDNYDTGTLTDEETECIERWVDNGGVLLVGTGENAEKTLGGLDFLDIQYEVTNDIAGNTFGWERFLDVSQLTFVILKDVGNHFGGDEFGFESSWGAGAVSVLPCALTELGGLGTDAYNEDNDATQEYVVGMILYDAGCNSELSYRLEDQMQDTSYNLQRIFSSLGKGSSHLKLGGLKAIVILYVIFVGPVLYLILRALKKRDFYWIAVPVSTLVGISLIYWAGRGFEIVDTNVYSVTIENLAKGGNAVTYLRCYDAGHKEWSLQMTEGYTYAGPLMVRYNYEDTENSYYHRIQKAGDRLSVGIKPTVGFEDAYFVAGTKKEAASGVISWDGDKTITNDTQWDFPYLAVVMEDSLRIYKDLPAGQRLHLEEDQFEFIDSVDSSASHTSYNSVYSPYEAYYYGYFRDSLYEEEKEDIDLKAALGMGISAAFAQPNPDRAVIVGVVENWDKAIDDDCSEVSYGCLYTILEEKDAIH